MGSQDMERHETSDTVVQATTCEPGGCIRDCDSPKVNKLETSSEDPHCYSGNCYSGSGTIDDPFVVSFRQCDPEDPRNWSLTKRGMITFVVSFSTWTIAYVSTAYSGALPFLMEDLYASRTLIVAGISLFVLGFAVGPLVWAPLSEIYGRRMPFLATFIIFAILQIPTALVTNVEGLLVLRCLSGTFGSAPLTNAGAAVGDIYEADRRGMALTVFAICPFLGPVMGPIFGGLISAGSSWRVNFWVMFGFIVLCILLIIFFMPETYHPTIISKRVKLLSKASKNQVYISMYDKRKEGEKESIAQVMKTNLTRPFHMLFTEVMVFLFALYQSVIYGITYMCFSSFPIVFQERRQWPVATGGLAFTGIGIGTLLGAVISFWDTSRYRKDIKRAGGKLPPEARLRLAAWAGTSLPIGLFGFAATAPYTNIHWIVPIIFSSLFGIGTIVAFVGTITYLVDAYVRYAASSIAANTVMRCLAGAAFPLFIEKMYESLGLLGGNMLIAGLSTLVTPVPYIFMKIGARARRSSKYAPS